MPMIKVLVVDDSSTVRLLLTWLLDSDPAIQVVGTACNGEEAVQMARRLKPDVITMDVNMPVLNGFEATQRIMSETPTPILIVTSSVDIQAVGGAMTALMAGALALLEKPVSPDNADFETQRAQLIKMVKAMAGTKVIRQRRSEDSHPQTATASDVDPHRPLVVAIAASTGGPAALATILRALPADFPAPILVVQHIGKGFVRGLVNWLDTLLSLSVKLAVDGEALQPATVYIAPDDTHLGISRAHCIRLDHTPLIGGFRPSANHLFSSVGQACGKQALGVVLTGMGSDGLEGARELVTRGGRIYAQDEASSVVFGMPKAVIDAKLAHDVWPLAAIGTELTKLVHRHGIR